MGDSLTLSLKYKIEQGPIKILEGAIGKAVEKSRKLEDQAGKTSKTLNKMTDGYRKRQDKANKSSNAMLGTLKKIAGAALTITGVMKGIDLASDFQETSDKLSDVYGKTTDTVLKSVDAMNNRLRVSKVDLTEYYANSGAIMKGLGLNTEKAFNKSNEAIQTAIDLASFHNLTTERASQAVISAMLGESEALKSSTGIIVLENMMAEYATTVGKTWKELNNTEKAMLRLDYIMKQSELQGASDNAYKTRDSFANLRKQLVGLGKDITTKTFSALTRELAPALKTSYEILKQNEGVIIGVGEAVGKTISSISEFAGWLNRNSAGAIATKTAMGLLATAYIIYKGAALGAFAVTKAQDAWRFAKTIPGIFMENSGIIKNAALLTIQKGAQLAVAASSKIMTAAQWALNLALNANPIGLIVAGVTALGVGLTVAYKKIEPFRKAVNQLWDKLKNSAIGKVVMSFIEKREENSSTAPETKTGSIPAYAKGTSFHSGGTALVGEKGPELVNLPRGSQVKTASETARITGGNSSIVIQGDTIQISLGAIQENFDTVWQKLERKLDARERRKAARIKALIGGNNL